MVSPQPPHAPVPLAPSGCTKATKGPRAATLQRIAVFGHHRDKLGAGYTCSLQAMSCVSRALPDLTALADNSSNPLQPEPPRMQPPPRPHGTPTGGSGGKIISFFPRRLSARGSMTLRRAKAAPLPAAPCSNKKSPPETFPEIFPPPSTLHRIWKQFVQTSYITRGIFYPRVT